MSWVGVGMEDMVITRGVNAAPVGQIMMNGAECSKTTLSSLDITRISHPSLVTCKLVLVFQTMR